MSYMLPVGFLEIANGAERTVEMLIVQEHADDCVEDAILASDPDEQRRKFRELVDVFEKVYR